MRSVPMVTVPEGTRGPWAVERFTVDRPPMRSERRNVPMGRYTRLTHAERGLVMSDTPDERRDHEPFAMNAKGHVLINGLGLGMCLGAALARPGVTKVTVVEADADVIALVGPHYDCAPLVEIVHCDAFAYRPPAGIRYGAVWHDIWDEISSDNLEGMIRLHRKYGRRTDWQGSWAREMCQWKRIGLVA